MPPEIAKSDESLPSQPLFFSEVGRLELAKRWDSRKAGHLPRVISPQVSIKSPRSGRPFSRTPAEGRDQVYRMTPQNAKLEANCLVAVQ
jgi:hypothetical protein